MASAHDTLVFSWECPKDWPMCSLAVVFQWLTRVHPSRLVLDRVCRHRSNKSKKQRMHAGRSWRDILPYSIGIGVFSTLKDFDVIHSTFQSCSGLIGLLLFDGEFHAKFRIREVTKHARVTYANWCCGRLPFVQGGDFLVDLSKFLLRWKLKSQEIIATLEWRFSS